MRVSFAPANVEAALRAVSSRFDSIFDVLAPTVQTKQIARIGNRIDDRRASARRKKAKNFARADQIRGELLEQGIILEDTKEGVRWKRK